MQQKRRLITSTIDTNHAEILGCVLLILMDIFRKKGIGFFGLFFQRWVSDRAFVSVTKKSTNENVHTTKTAL